MAAELGRSRTSVHNRMCRGLLRERRSRAMKFSDEQAAELIRSLDAGVTRRELATQHDIPYGLLKDYLRRLKIRLNRRSRNGAVWQDEDHALILAMRLDQGLTRGEISRRTGFPDSTISRTLRCLGSRRENKLVPYSAVEDIQLCDLREHERLTWKEVAARMKGRTLHSCRRRYNDSLKGREAADTMSVADTNKETVRMLADDSVLPAATIQLERPRGPSIFSELDSNVRCSVRTFVCTHMEVWGTCGDYAIDPNIERKQVPLSIKTGLRDAMLTLGRYSHAFDDVLPKLLFGSGIDTFK
ncbi:hypothetical protein LTR15_009292 [Elasticomyces elasticus]|nr:hypothetical protein LTR15_009292 [Elasticomyces elasticus]